MIKSGIFFFTKDNKSTEEAPSVLPLAKLVYIVDFYFWGIRKMYRFVFGDWGFGRK